MEYAYAIYFYTNPQSLSFCGYAGVTCFNYVLFNGKKSLLLIVCMFIFKTYIKKSLSKRLVINYGEGGLQHEKIVGPKLFAPPLEIG